MNFGECGECDSEFHSLFPFTAISIQLPAKYLIIILIAHYPMSQQVEDTARLFWVRCADVGLDFNYVIVSGSEKKVIDKTIVHKFEFHAIKLEEMTTCMKLKIRENVYASLSSGDIYRL